MTVVHAMSVGLTDRLRANDRALWPLIEAVDEPSREAAIEALITNVTHPLTTTILNRLRRLEPNFQSEDVQEITSLIAVRLIRKLRATAVHEEHAIATLSGYVSMLTHNTWHDFRRSRYPQRYRLKRNLRYVMTRAEPFALWETSEHVVAGLSKWNGSPPGTASDAPTRFSATRVMCDKTRPAAALQEIFDKTGHPLVFESLVDVVAELWGVRDAVTESVGDFAPDDRRDQLTSLEEREYLQALWREIGELPDNQRAALLLNLRDSGGYNALTLFLVLNVAGVADLARALGVTEETLNRIWEELPLDDLKIGQRLNLTRQQVINLRRSARSRLARRMGKLK